MTVSRWWFHMIVATVIGSNTVSIVMEADTDNPEKFYWFEQACGGVGARILVVAGFVFDKVIKVRRHGFDGFGGLSKGAIFVSNPERPTHFSGSAEFHLRPASCSTSWSCCAASACGRGSSFAVRGARCELPLSRTARPMPRANMRPTSFVQPFARAFLPSQAQKVHPEEACHQRSDQLGVGPTSWRRRRQKGQQA